MIGLLLPKRILLKFVVKKFYYVTQLIKLPIKWHWPIRKSSLFGCHMYEQPLYVTVRIIQQLNAMNYAQHLSTENTQNRVRINFRTIYPSSTYEQL